MATEQELLAQIEQLNTEVSAIHDTVGDGDPSKTQYETVVEKNRQIAELEGQVKTIRDQRETWAATRSQAQHRAAESRKAVNRLGVGAANDGDGDRKGGDRRSRKTPGQLVLSDAGFEAWRKEHVNGGAFTTAKFGASPRVTFGQSLKALVATTDVAGTEFYGMPPGGFMGRPLNIRDLITTGSTGSNSVDFVVEGTWVNRAAPVADATDSSGSSGSKPESTIDFDPDSTTVKTIAHFVAVPRSALADQGQLEMYIDSFLRYGVNEELEDQIVAGSGSGNNFTGILNTSGIQTQAFSTDILTTLRKARTAVRIGGRATPTAFGMHPNDWEAIDLLQDNEGRYYYGGPSVIGQPRLWGLPVVESEGITEGYAICADWRKAVLLDREMVQILMSDSHSDFFTRNLVAVLGELRAAFFVVRPAAFVSADLTA